MSVESLCRRLLEQHLNEISNKLGKKNQKNEKEVPIELNEHKYMAGKARIEQSSKIVKLRNWKE